MNFIALYSGFLYFPEDKTAYIPAAIEFFILILLCILVFTWIKRISRKQALKAKEIEDRILGERQQNLENRTQE
ncbi:hypothetical protein [Ureibacillus manganicus]|uniref:Uncharacterized protein n=1 Tax=Ureibacillus manganicus DSM 26584 TaxID=1384049 RepID=A0A0A3I614_9BACL|nr:hypothetical protein [Ureibacillus manganicus]KGR78138.1 hypothetical protein CD29_11970 [Ureibacillus manganicus DSM 26584]